MNFKNDMTRSLDERVTPDKDDTDLEEQVARERNKIKKWVEHLTEPQLKQLLGYNYGFSIKDLLKRTKNPPISAEDADLLKRLSGTMRQAQKAAERTLQDKLKRNKNEVAAEVANVVDDTGIIERQRELKEEAEKEEARVLAALKKMKEDRLRARKGEQDD